VCSQNAVHRINPFGEDMKIALVGASGFIGSALRKEALSRGHTVTALVTDPSKIAPADGLQAVKADATDAQALVPLFEGQDAVISAFSGHAQEDVRGAYGRGIRSIIAAARQAKRRLLVVGGAGSLEVAPGRQLLDTPDFPAAYRGSAEGARDALQWLREETALDWAMLSPSAMIAPGGRTGRFRLGTDQLLVAPDGSSRISVEDFAVAMLDEAQQPRHRGQRFTVGY
jgi:putative NADH-flavin reductase